MSLVYHVDVDACDTGYICQLGISHNLLLPNAVTVMNTTQVPKYQVSQVQ